MGSRTRGNGKRRAGLEGFCARENTRLTKEWLKGGAKKEEQPKFLTPAGRTARRKIYGRMAKAL